MNEKLRIVPETELEDGYCKTFKAIYDEPLYGKSVTFDTPNFSPIISISPQINMRKIRLDLTPVLSSHTKFYTMKIYDYNNVIGSQIKKIKQKTLDGKYAEEEFRNFFFGNVMILDFSPESLEYTKNLDKMAMTPNLPIEVTKLANRLSDMHNHLQTKDFVKERDTIISNFWEKILTNTKTLYDFEGKVFDQGLNAFGDIITPFTKLIKTKTDLQDVKKINNEWIKLNTINSKPTVAYVLLHPSVLRNDYLIYEVADYIKTLKVDILIFKIKNLELADGSKHVLPRENLKEINKIISEKRLKEELLVIGLECGEQLYPFSLQTCDVLSTSASMYDLESGEGGISDSGAGYGRAIDEESLARLDFSMWQREFNRTGVFPCTHENVCQKRITTMDTEQYPNYQWWVDSRIHNLLAIDGWLKMVAESIPQGHAGLAFNRLENSPLRILTELLIPNYNNSPLDV